MRVSTGRKGDERKMMNNLMKTVMVAGFIASVLAVQARLGAEELTGKEIMKLEDTENEAKDEIMIMSMRLINKRGQERNRKVTFTVKKVNEEDENILVRFLEPADVAGVGLLTLEHAATEDDQWLYLPALKKERRISASDQSDNFMGTDFTYEDMKSEKLNDHDYTLLREDSFNGADCYVVEAIPSTERQKKESGYSKREIWIRTDNFLRVHVKYYDQRGEYFKVGNRSDIEEVLPGIFRPNYVEMKNLKTGHTTELTFEGRELNSGLDDSVFSLRELRRPSRR
jgi:outer membrane lipoprotein-sorting protein